MHTSSRSASSTPESSEYVWESAKNAAAISHLEVVPAGRGSHELIAVHQDGSLRGLSANLRQEQWTTGSGRDVTVEHTFIQSATEAKEGFMKNRVDLLMFLETTGKDQDELRDLTAIISVITRSNTDQKRFLHVFAVKPPSAESVAQISSRAQSLIQWELPGSAQDTKSTPQYNFDKASGQLSVVRDTSLATYTFTTLGPRLSNQLQHLPQGPAISSFIPLPQSLSLVMTSDTCSLLNTHYNSIMASTTTNALDVLPPPSKKRKLDPTKTALSSAIQLVDYFRTLHIALAIKDDTLLAIQLHFPVPIRGRTSTKPLATPRLIDSLGHGIPSTSENNIKKALPAISARRIDELALTDPSLATLAHVFFPLAQPSGRRSQKDYVNLEGLVQSLKWILRSFSTPPATEQQQAQLTNGDTATIPAPNGSNGTLTHAATATNSDPNEESFLAEVSAANADLSHAVALISSASTSSAAATDPREVDVVTLRAMTLEHLLTELGTSHPHTLLTRTLRAQLSQHDLFLLIELLRHALEQGGWASKVLDVYPEEVDPELETEQERIDGGGLDSSVRVIGSLISCAVDALGAGAWLTGGIAVNADDFSSDDDDEDEMMDLDTANSSTTRPLLPTLRHLTTTVLEVTQEAAFFRSFLADFLRYADTLAAAPVGVQNRLANAMANEQGAGQTGGMLPFGVRAARGIEATVVKAGGEVRARSKREIAGRIAREVGVYGFERVRV